MLGTNSSLLLDAVIAAALFLIALAMRFGSSRRFKLKGRTASGGSDLLLGGLIAAVIFCLTLMLAFAIPSTR